MSSLEKEKTRLRSYLFVSVALLMAAVFLMGLILGYTKTTAKATYEQDSAIFIEGNNETVTPAMVSTREYSGNLTRMNEGELMIGKEKIKISLKEGESINDEILIKNTGNENVKININTEQAKILVNVSNKEFYLDKGEEEKVLFEFGTGKLEPGLYLGEIEISNGYIKRRIFLITEIESANSTIETSLKVPSKYYEIFKDDEIETFLSLITDKKENITLRYYIKGEGMKSILVGEEKTEVNKSKIITKNIVIPKSLDYGSYVLYVEASSNNKIAIDSVEFRIIKSPLIDNVFVKMGILLIGISAIGYIVLKYF